MNNLLNEADYIENKNNQEQIEKLTQRSYDIQRKIKLLAMLLADTKKELIERGAEDSFKYTLFDLMPMEALDKQESLGEFKDLAIAEFFQNEDNLNGKKTNHL